MNLVRQIEQFIEGLFRDESRAQDFIRSPESTMREAGLQNATPAQVHAVAATAAPSVAMGGGDPVVGLQRAVASHHGIAQETFAPTFHPQRVITPQEAHAEVASHTVASPATVVNDSHAFNLGLDFGDITFGNKSTAVGDGAVAIGGNNSGGIQSGKGSIHGNNNDVNNGTVKTGDGSAATVGDGNKTEGGSEKAGGGITDGNHGPVVQGTGTGTDHGTGTGTGTGTGGTGTGTGTGETAKGGATAQPDSHVIDTNHPAAGGPAATGANGGEGVIKDPATTAQQPDTTQKTLAANGDHSSHIDTSAHVAGNQNMIDTGHDINGMADAHNTQVADTFNHDASMHNVDNTSGSFNDTGSHNTGTEATGFEGGDFGIPGA